MLLLTALLALPFLSSLTSAAKGPWDAVFDTRKTEARRCWANRNGEQWARWYEEGEQIERGSLVYECRDGKLVPAGCLDEAGNHVPLDGTFVSLSTNLVLNCVPWGGMRKLQTVGCAAGEDQGQPAGKAFMVGDTWADNTKSKTWWECAREGEAVRARLGGCVDSATLNRLRVGESIDRAQTTYECQAKGDTVALVPVGCVVNNATHYRVGSQWQDGDFLFYCKRTADGTCEKSCVGCVLEGRRLYNGDRVRQDQAVLQCEVRPKRHALAAVACVSEGGVERAPECKWNDPSHDGTYRVKRQCVVREGRATIALLGCVFEKDGFARLTLKPNSFTMWRESMDHPPLGVLCRTVIVDGQERPHLESFPVEETRHRTAGLEEDVNPMMT